MPTWDDLDDDPDTGDSVPVSFLELEGRTLELRACFIGPTEPDPKVEGMIWVDNSSSPYKVKQYLKIDAGAAAWQPIGPLSRLWAPINADPSVTDDRAAPFQYKALRPENVAALSTPGANNASLLEYRTTDGEMFYADQPVSGGSKGLLSVKATGSYDTVELPLEGDVGNDGTNPPTQQRKGVLEGWLFDATNEKRTFAVPCPKNWRGASDLKLRVAQVLNQAETPGDDIEWIGEIRTLAPGADKVTKAATALAVATTDIGADTEGTDDGGGPFVTELVIDHDDVTNPVAALSLLLITIWRNTVGGAGKVGGVIVYRVELAYEQKPRHERV